MTLMSVFFLPESAWVGDVIPYVHDGEFHLFYLHERRLPGVGMGWHLVTTTDLVHLEDRGIALPSGGPEAPDFNVYTGSIVTDEVGSHHLYYTAQNPNRLGPDGRPLQLVMHAVSTDAMRTWTKHPDDTFGAGPGYETGDWRDPYVFADPNSKLWRMVITARHDHGPQRRRGVLAQYISTDLRHWTPAAPIWDPGRHLAHECADIFGWGEWWYLVYSEFSDSFATKYRMARDLSGPWLAPEQDTIDGRAFYAAKSAERDGRRFFFGWIATREGARDDGPWEWAGSLAILEAHQRPDGTLGFAPPAELLDSFDADVPAALPSTTIGRRDGYQAVLATTALPATCRIRVEFELGTSRGEFGILLRASKDGDRAHVLRLEPRRGRMVVDRWPRPSTGGEQWHISGDVAHTVELERPCQLRPGRHHLDIILDGDICVASLDGQVTVSTRMYSTWGDRFGVFSADGTVTVTDLRIATRSHPPIPNSINGDES